MSLRVIRIGTILIFAGLFIYFFIRLFRINPQPTILYGARLLGGGDLIEFYSDAFGREGDNTIRVCGVERHDTDGDGFNEWLIFYQPDPKQGRIWREPCPDESPRFGVIYDNDRGEPPVLFPYTLDTPDRTLLGEGAVYLDRKEIVVNRVSPEIDPSIGDQRELLFYSTGSGGNRLTIFKFQENSSLTDSPTDHPPRYQILGIFSGQGPITYDENSHNVTIFDPYSENRSQLSVKHVYALHGSTEHETYMREEGAAELAAPIISTIEFSSNANPPQDIYNAEYPEHILLAFYQSLDSSRALDWESKDFLAGSDDAPGDARKNLNAGNWGYFFLQDNDGSLDVNSITDLAIRQIQYFPRVETESTVQTIEGEQPQRGRVDIEVAGPFIPANIMSFELVYLKGQWKINQRLK